MKTTFEELRFIAFAGCRSDILSKNNSLTSISKVFRKTFIPPPCMWNSKKIITIMKFAEAFGYSYHHQYVTHIPLRFQNLGASSF